MEHLPYITYGQIVLESCPGQGRVYCHLLTVVSDTHLRYSRVSLFTRYFNVVVF